MVMSILVALLSIAIHEYAHCKFADMAGDPTPGIYGRVTLNPLVHLDPLGTIMIVFTSISGFGIGWGRPAPMDPRKMKDPRWDHFWAVAAGPLSNILQAGIYAIVLRGLILAGMVGPGQLELLKVFLILGVIVNIGLALFNLIPLGPLDGHWLVGLLMPEPQRIRWFQWNRVAGSILLLILVLGGPFIRSIIGFDPIDTVLFRPAMFLTRFFLGI
jgi:Zn-dependent protease